MDKFLYDKVNTRYPFNYSAVGEPLSGQKKSNKLKKNYFWP